MAGTQPKCGNGGVSDAVTSELGDGQSSHPVKNPASVLWQVFLPGVAYPGVRDNRSNLNTKTGYEKKSSLSIYIILHSLNQFLLHLHSVTK